MEKKESDSSKRPLLAIPAKVGRKRRSQEENEEIKRKKDKLRARVATARRGTGASAVDKRRPVTALQPVYCMLQTLLSAGRPASCSVTGACRWEAPRGGRCELGQVGSWSAERRGLCV